MKGLEREKKEERKLKKREEKQKGWPEVGRIVLEEWGK